MPNSSAIPHDDTSRSILLKQLSTQLPTYASILELNSDEITKVATASSWFDYLLNGQEVAQNYSHAMFSLKRILRDGPANTDITLPAPPAMPTPPTGTPFSDIFGFVGPLMTRIKKHPNYTETMGKTLGIIPAVSVPLDISLLQPTLSVDFKAATQYYIGKSTVHTR